MNTLSQGYISGVEKVKVSGFTLIEVLLVICIIAVLATASFPLYHYFFTYSSLDAVSLEVKQNIRLAAEKAKSGENDSSCGLYFQLNQYTLYQGASYATRNDDYDVIYTLPANVEFAGLGEITFQFKTGLPAVTGTITLINIVNDAQKNITINQAGLIY